MVCGAGLAGVVPFPCCGHRKLVGGGETPKKKLNLGHPRSSSVEKQGNNVKPLEEPVLVVVGGGAAGVFGAARAKTICPQMKVVVVEKAQLLSKVRISGGGRCNVTTGLHWDPLPLAGQYPRGHKELRGLFFRTHGPKDTVAWFSKRGVSLKKEEDGRMFPVTDSSSTIVDCLLNEAHRAGDASIRQ